MEAVLKTVNQSYDVVRNRLQHVRGLSRKIYTGSTRVAIASDTASISIQSGTKNYRCSCFTIDELRLHGIRVNGERKDNSKLGYMVIAFNSIEMQ